MRIIISTFIGLLMGILTPYITQAETRQTTTASENSISVTDSVTDVVSSGNRQLHIYLPMTALYPTEWPKLSPSPKEGIDFFIERDTTVTRLIQLSENGGQSREGFDCGQLGHVEVFVFGPEGVSNKLGNIAVKLIHIDKEGNRIIETRYTREEGSKRGSIQFPMNHDYAEVSIAEDTDGQPATSETIRVTSIPLHINNQWLSKAGYCHDSQSCWMLRHDNTCQGQLSWNIVFKQS
ncbi:MAG: hypothetical protein AAF702_31635 [Chloroflexota bacterium]